MTILGECKSVFHDVSRKVESFRTERTWGHLWSTKMKLIQKCRIKPRCYTADAANCCLQALLCSPKAGWWPPMGRTPAAQKRHADVVRNCRWGLPISFGVAVKRHYFGREGLHEPHSAYLAWRLWSELAVWWETGWPCWFQRQGTWRNMRHQVLLVLWFSGHHNWWMALVETKLLAHGFSNAHVWKTSRPVLTSPISMTHSRNMEEGKTESWTL